MHFLRFCAKVALTLCLAVGGTGAAFAVSDIQTFRLENGLTVLIKEDSRFPLVSVRLFVKAGSAWEKPEEAGMSHLLEHMVFKGSKTSGPGVDKRVENAGGSMNAYTSYDMTTYLTDLPAAKWKDAMTAVRDLAFDPLLRQEDLDAEREVVIAEKKQRGDNPVTKLVQKALAHTLKGTPYESPVIGNEKALRAMTPEMMRDYIRRHYDPRDMVLAVAGDVKAVEVLEEAKLLFGSYENHNVRRLEPSVDPASLAQGLVVDVEKGPWDKAFVALSFPLPGMRHELLPAVDVLAHLLSGDDTALLPVRFRIEKPVVDSVSASPMMFERAGAFFVLAQLDADKVEEFVRGMGETLAALKASDFSDAELARARLNLEDSYLRSLENIASIAETMGSEYFYDPASLGGERYLSAVRGVSREQVQEVLDLWLRPEALSVSALVPQKAADGKKSLDEKAIRAALVKGWPEAGKTLEKSRAGEKDSGALKSEVVNLGEGRTLVLLPDRSLPYVSATLSFSGGELLVPDSQEGLAALTAAVLTTGTKKRSLNDINVYLSGRAAGLSAGSGMRSFSVQMDAPARFAPEVFSLMKEVLEEPAFREEDMERQKREQTAAIVSREQDAMGLLGRNMRRFLFQKGAYAHRSEGDPSVIAAFTAKDAAAFWNRQKTMPWVLSVAGDFDRAQVEKFAASLPVPSQKAVKSEAPGWNGERGLNMTLPGRNQAVYLMLFPTAGTESSDRAALRLLSESLGGFTGKLYQELREKQSLGYSVFPVDWAGPDTGFLAFGIIASPENLDKARASFESIVRDVHENLLPAETIERAKAVAEADYYRARQSRAMRAAEGASAVLDGHELDYGRKKLEEMKAVDAETLRKTARRYLKLENAYDLRVTP